MYVPVLKCNQETSLCNKASWSISSYLLAIMRVAYQSLLSSHWALKSRWGFNKFIGKGHNAVHMQGVKIRKNNSNDMNLKTN